MTPRPAASLLVLAGTAWVTGAPLARAQAPHRPGSGDRVARLFDFEEATTNPLPVPRHWSRVTDEQDALSGALPPYNRVELDYSAAYAGEGSVRLRARGGGTLLRLNPGTIPVFPGGDYLVSAWVRTAGVEHDRAFVAARFLNERSEPIAASERLSAPLVSAGGWREVSLLLRGEWPEAAFIQIDLRLLPPSQFRPPESPPDPHRVWMEDFDAWAWFDEVAIVQVPRLDIRTESPANVVVAPDRPRITFSLRDLAGESLVARLTLLDGGGRAVDSAQIPGIGGRTRHTWDPSGATLGWYRAAVEIHNPTRRVGAAFVDFVRIAPPTPPGESAIGAARLGVVVDGTPPWADLPTLARGAGAAWISLPVWEAHTSPRSLADSLAAIDTAVDALLSQRTEVDFRLPRAPAALAEQTRSVPGNPAAALAAPGGLWRPFLTPLLESHGQVVQRWELGGVEGLEARPTTPQLAGAYAAIASLVPGPRISLAWSTDIALDTALQSGGGAAGGFSLFVPLGTSPSEAVAWIGGNGAGPPRRFVLECEDEDLVGRHAAADTLIQRTIETLAAGARDAGILSPWTIGGRHPGQTMPSAAMAAMANLSQRLEGRQLAGQLAVGDGIACYLLEPAEGSPRGAALVAWRTRPGAGVIDMPLAAGGVRRVDRWGNQADVPPVADGSGIGSHRVEVASSPVFIEGVDWDLIRFFQSLRLDPPFLATEDAEHPSALVLSNPWPTSISGKMVVREPGGFDGRSAGDRTWIIAPRVQDFSVAAGESASLPLSISFSPGEEVGSHHLTVEFDIGGAGEYRGVLFRVPFAIGMRTIALDLSYRLGPTPTGPDVIVEARVTNLSDRETVLEAVAFAPGQPRGSAALGSLAPNQQTVRRFAFPGAAATLRGQRVYISLVDPDSPARLTRSVMVE